MVNVDKYLGLTRSKLRQIVWTVTCCSSFRGPYALHSDTRGPLCSGSGSGLMLPHHYSSLVICIIFQLHMGFPALMPFSRPFPWPKTLPSCLLGPSVPISQAQLKSYSLCQAPSSLTSPNHSHFLHSVTSVVSDSVACLVFSLASVSRSHIQAIQSP